MSKILKSINILSLIMYCVDQLGSTIVIIAKIIEKDRSIVLFACSLFI